MKRIAFHIQKGGVGKTTLSGNVAYYMSLKKRVCLVDADPQGNASSWFITEAPQYELADVLSGSVSISEALCSISEKFYILPTFGIDGGLKEYAESKLFKEPFIFEDVNEALQGAGFDLVIYDLSPGMSQLERTVISSVDEVITPLTPEFFSIDGIEIFNSELKKINKSFRKQVKHNKIVCNSLNKSFSRHREISGNFNALDYQLFTIPQDSKIAEAQLYNSSIFQYYPESKSIPEIVRLCEAL